MSLRSTSRSLLAVAVATSLLASAPALARTADEGVRTSSLAGTASPRQDLRGEHARDAARAITHAPPVTRSQDLRGEMARDAARAIPIPLAPLQDLRGEFARDSTWPTEAQIAAASRKPAEPAKSLPATSGDDRNVTWLIVLVGLAGAAIAAGGTAGVRSHRHA